jgi:hypothetical protein
MKTNRFQQLMGEYVIAPPNKKRRAAKKVYTEYYKFLRKLEKQAVEKEAQNLVFTPKIEKR